jgi:hypothetical protein
VSVYAYVRMCMCCCACGYISAYSCTYICVYASICCDDFHISAQALVYAVKPFVSVTFTVADVTVQADVDLVPAAAAAAIVSVVSDVTVVVTAWAVAVSVAGVV